MKIPFVKMQGAGNDFIIIKRENLPVDVNVSSFVTAACHRTFGIGADGLMIYSSSIIADAKMLYFNQDGSQGEMCGNGIRCFARFVMQELSATNDSPLTIETIVGTLEVFVAEKKETSSLIRVNMGTPSGVVNNERINVEGKVYVYDHLVVGVPHVVIFVEDEGSRVVESTGPIIERDQRFPNGTNVNFVQVINTKNIKVWTWERGAGHTLACGTGITSAFAAARHHGYVDSKVVADAEGGILTLEETQTGIIMTGPATDICEGIYYYNESMQYSWKGVK